jgi:hypothetical protein
MILKRKDEKRRKRGQLDPNSGSSGRPIQGFVLTFRIGYTSINISSIESNESKTISDLEKDGLIK